VGWRGVEPEPPEPQTGDKRTPEVAHAES